MSERAAAVVAPSGPVAASSRPAAKLERRCACGNHTIGGGECANCARAHSTLFRRAAAPTEGGSLPGSVRQTLRQAGQPLQADVRTDFELRFGHDLSGVRVHSDYHAAISARAIGAHAYALGSHIVFGDRQYAPHTSQGRELLAHELVHTLQQGAVPPSSFDSVRIGRDTDPAEREADRLAADALADPAPITVDPTPPRLMRKVSKDFATIKSDLTYGVFDWAITDKEAREVLGILKGLSKQDLKDTVAAMDREGIADRLFDQLPADDVKANKDFLQDVARLRSWSEKGPDGKQRTRQGSCDPTQANAIDAAHLRGADWLDQTLGKLAALKAAPKDAAQKSVADIFNKYFFSLDEQVIDYVFAVLQGVRADFRRWELFRLDCFGDWSPTCHANGAVAHGGKPPTVTFCSNYFEGSEAGQTQTLIHEMAHIQPNVTHITDRAYHSDRQVRAMSPPEALTNAESYALLVWHLVQGRSGVDAPVDEFEDCPDDWKQLLKQAMAHTQRSNRNAQTKFSKLTPATLPTELVAQEQGWLGGRDRKAINNALDIFDEAQKKFRESTTFECEPKGGGRCDNATFYWYFTGHLHVCPSWPKLPVTEREVQLLAGFYGYIGAGSNSDERLRLARLASSVSARGWAAPSAADVLGGPTGWTADSIHLEVAPVQPTSPKHAYFLEDGAMHQRLSQDLPVYQGPQCGKGPLAFQQRLDFFVDYSNSPRPRPFPVPQLRADFTLNTAGQGQSWQYEDQRPTYAGAGAPLHHQLPEPIDLSLADDGTLHSRIRMDDPGSGVSRVYEDDLTIKAKDPCPKVATAADPRPSIQKDDQAFANQLGDFVADARSKIDALLQGQPPKDDAWAVRSNPNVQAVQTLLGDLESDIKGGHLLIRFDQPVGTSQSARYESVDDVMHLQPPKDVDLAKEVVDLVHEYTHVRQDRAEEAALIARKAPATFGKDVDLGHEIEARQEETYFTRLLQLAGIKFGAKADTFNIEVTARGFVRRFEAERTGKPKERREAEKSVRTTIESAYQQQFKDNGSFGDYPIEISDNSHALLYASWSGKGPPVDLGMLPDDVVDVAGLRSHLYRTLNSYAGRPALFTGPKRQAYEKVLFTVFFRQQRLLQFGFEKD